jgi:type IV pilus assembly protein PilX
MGESVMNHPKKQQGVVLVILLIALVAISLAGVALLRTVDTSNVVSGNIAFNEAALQLSDVGAELAYTDINSNLYNIFTNSAIPVCLSDVTLCPKNTAGQSYFYPNYFSISTTTKLPISSSGAALAMSDPVSVSLPGDTTPSYSIQYIIERMCIGTASTQEVATFTKCRAVPDYSGGVLMPINTSASGLPSYGKLFFRITVQVSGPRNTRGLAQYFYGVKDTVYQ